MQYASERFVSRESDVVQRPIETGDRSPIHFVMGSVAAVHPNDEGLATEQVGVGRRPPERLGPICGQALGVLRVETMAESMVNYFVLEHPGVPRAGQAKERVFSTNGFVDSLHGSTMVSGKSESVHARRQSRVGYAALRPSRPKSLAYTKQESNPQPA
ncbi:MAG TPA: hypothetical protein VMF30_15030, partial [Pirellulales bacterium]|nr:hypothetical protein [Pirellulales bacterium]